ncbi:MAG: hypothetical protein ACOC80_11305 [Petrotogales bacterium]
MKMKMKIISIFVCTLLICTGLTVSGNLINEKDDNFKIQSENNTFNEFDLIIGKINNLHEEIINDRVRYAFHAEWLIIIIRAFFPPLVSLVLPVKRIFEKDIDISIPKDSFYGHISEGKIFGFMLFL